MALNPVVFSKVIIGVFSNGYLEFIADIFNIFLEVKRKTEDTKV